MLPTSRDLLAVLRFVENPRDRVSGFRVMQLVQGVGPGSAERVLDYMMMAADPLGALAYAPRPPRAGEHWTSFLEMVTDLRSSGAGWPAELERARLCGTSPISTEFTTMPFHAGRI
jgi:DNA helicase-2/ATP-dependent DNA helicase PcrA